MYTRLNVKTGNDLKIDNYVTRFYLTTVMSQQCENKKKIYTALSSPTTVKLYPKCLL